MKTLLFSAALLMSITSCRHQKAATSTVNNNPPAPTVISSQGEVLIQTDESTTATIEIYNPPDTVVTTVSAPSNIDSTQTIYRLTISFISKGSGIDRKTEEDFELWLNEQPKHPAYEKTHWGREGEINICLKLDELSTREQEIFVRDVRTRLADNALVFVTEYTVCKGKKDQ